jgi:DNA-binding response OmpR family regulator
MDAGGVAVVDWPAGQEARVSATASGRPCLLLVDRDAPPPELALTEDWVRLPASHIDVAARVRALAQRVEPPAPVVDPALEDGVLRVNGSWVAIPPVEGRLLSALLERPGAVVSRAALARAGWPERQPDRNTLDVHIGRLRRRISPVGMRLATVRSRGYLLET